MGAKDNFTQEEWRILLKTPMLVSYAVVGSAPSGEQDYIQEMSAVADAIVEGKQRAEQNSLLGAVIADIVTNAEDEQRGQTEKLLVGEVKDRALESCRAVAGLLQTKTSAEEADEYKRWVVGVAHRVAAAAKEGGLFGFGGTQISGSEVAIINEVGEALGV